MQAWQVTVAAVWHRLTVEEAEVGLVAADILAVRRVVVGEKEASAIVSAGENVCRASVGSSLQTEA